MKELADAGYDAGMIDDAVKSYTESLFQLDASEVPLRVKDPDGHIQDVVFVDGAGEVQRAAMRDEEGLTLLIVWGEQPKPDWKLRVSMRTPKNLVRHAFVVKDVPLP